MQQTWAAPSYQNSYNEAHSFADQNSNFALALCASRVFEFAQRRVARSVGAVSQQRRSNGTCASSCWRTCHYPIQVLTRMFAQEVNAEKTGVHVSKARVEEFEDQAMGRRTGQARNATIPSFLAYDGTARVKARVEACMV